MYVRELLPKVTKERLVQMPHPNAWFLASVYFCLTSLTSTLYCIAIGDHSFGSGPMTDIKLFFEVKEKISQDKFRILKPFWNDFFFYEKIFGDGIKASIEMGHDICSNKFLLKKNCLLFSTYLSKRILTKFKVEEF